MINKHKNIFTITFGNEIHFGEIPLFRGAVLKSLSEDSSVLFHNHQSDQSYRYSYPLIQYKRIKGKAAIFCIDEGVEVIGQFLSTQNSALKLGDREITLSIESVHPHRFLIQAWDTTFHYRVTNWLPLNSDNYLQYKAIDGCSERVSFLENILVGNLLSFAKGVGIEVEKKIECKLVSMRDPRLIRVKNVRMMSFNVEFKTNLSLPNYVGIGKHASFGYGVITRVVPLSYDNK